METTGNAVGSELDASGGGVFVITSSFRCAQG